MDIHHLKYFLAVCETLNFTKAAQNCNVSQPALSRAVQQLEAEIGGLLLRRERNLTHITDLGMLLKPHFEQVIAGIGNVRLEARRFLTLEKASLNLGIMCTVGPTRFTALIGNISKLIPGMSLHLIEGTPPELIEELTKGSLDAAIMASAEGFHERLDRVVLYRERFVIAFPAGHRFGAMDTIPIAEIDGENYLRRINCEFRDHLSALVEARGAHVHLSSASEREDWIQNMVAGGLGICFIPEFSAVLPGIEMRPVSDPEIFRDVCFVTMAGRRHSPSLAKFLASIKSYPFPSSRYATAGLSP
jgi:LysR family hydrogen peroxide-inducible transcriptional activator